MKKYLVQEQTTLKNFTDNTCAQASFYWNALLRAREIKVNGVKVSADCSLKAGDEVCYFLTPAQEKRSAFEIVYEDELVLVVDKESGVNSEAVFSALQAEGECYFIHRLDRNTAGLLAFAKTKGAEKELLSAFRNRCVVKIYEALVFGKMPAKHAVEEAFLQKDEKSATVKISPTRGEKIITEYEVVREYEQTSLLRVTLHTGKTHQIRAHLAYLRHPIVGDNKYGDSGKNKEMHAMRQRLVAKSLQIKGEGVLSYLADKVFYSRHSAEE